MTTPTQQASHSSEHCFVKGPTSRGSRVANSYVKGGVVSWPGLLRQVVGMAPDHIHADGSEHDVGLVADLQPPLLPVVLDAGSANLG